jgi:chemotaxis signal transduction protein
MIRTALMEAFDLPYLLFYLGEELYAISVAFVHEMLRTPSVTKVPGGAAAERGVIELRGRIMKLIDLRRRIGMRPLAEELSEFESMFLQLKADHIRWLEELEACIRENRDFRLATDPHKCNFGRWYDRFRTNNDLLAKHLPRFEAPHNAIHQTAAEALAIAGAEGPDQALSLIAKKRKTCLADVIRLFDQVIGLLHETNTEIAVVISSNGKPLAITVDRVLAVERLSMETLRNPPVFCGNTRDILKIGQRKNSDELVTVLDPEHMICST